MDEMKKNQPDKNRETDQRRAGQSDATDASADDMPTLRFDEGERKPAPIEGTGSDGVRKAVTGEPAGDKDAKPHDAGIEATMPPGEGRDPKRNTM
jgi:hypothetical protein